MLPVFAPASQRRRGLSGIAPPGYVLVGFKVVVVATVDGPLATQVSAVFADPNNMSAVFTSAGAESMFASMNTTGLVISQEVVVLRPY